MPDHYFFDTLNMVYAGDLKKAGFETRVFDHNISGMDDQVEALAPLQDAIEKFGASILLFDKIHSDDLVPLLRGPEVKAVGALQQPGASARPGVDFELPHRDREPLLQVVEALAKGDKASLNTIPGVQTSEGKTTISFKPSVERLFDDFDMAYDLLEVIRASPEKAPLRKHVFGNLGCPYRNAPNRTGFLDGIPIPEELTERGCTFCDRGDYDRIRPIKALRLLRDQIQQVRSAFPAMEQLILVDEYGLRYADEFIDMAIEEGLENVEIFFSARVEYILKFQKRFEEALDRAKGKLTLVMYLVGVENLSPFELWRFNKGVDVSTMVKALGALRGYTEKHEHFRIEPSFGYIMFTPWTTPTDLYLNLVYLQRLSFEQWRQAAAITRLRLYPDNALYYRAKADGLLLVEEREGADASERYGYEAEAPWRFKHAITQEIYDKTYRSRSGEEALKVLKRELRPLLPPIKIALEKLDMSDKEVLRRGALGEIQALYAQP